MARGRKGTGVQLRANDIRIRFTRNGVRHEEPLDWKPTKSNEKAAIKFAESVKTAIANGTFTFAKFFPGSKHASTEKTETTVAHYATLWRTSRSELSHAVKIKDRLAVEFWMRRIGQPLEGPALADEVAQEIGAAVEMGALLPSRVEAIVGAYPWKGAKHRNNMLIVLRGIFDKWVNDDKRNRLDPVDGVKNQKVQKKRPDPYNAEDTDAIVADMYSHYDERIGAYYEAAFFAGFRPEEEIALAWTKLDERTKTGVIDTAKHRGKEGPTKNYETRVVEFNDRAWAAIMRMKKWTAFKKHGKVFENPKTGDAWASEADQRDLYWTPTLKRLRMRHRRAYQTRSTCATRMLMEGLDPSYCARQLGHSLRVFWEVYADWINSAANERQRQKMNAGLARPRDDTKEGAA